MKQLILGFLLVCSLAFVQCAHPRHIAVSVDQSLFELMNDIHGLEQTTLCGQPTCFNVPARVTPAWTQVKSENFNRKLLPAVDAGRQFNALLITWNPANPPPPSIDAAIDSLGQSLTAIVYDFPPGLTRDKIIMNIGLGQALVLKAFHIILTVKGQ